MMTELGLSDYTPKELAIKLGVHFTCIYNYIEEGKIEAFNIGEGSKRPRWRISGAEAERFAKSFKKNEGCGNRTNHPKRPKKKKEVDILKEFRAVKDQLLELSIKMEELEKELERRGNENR